MGPVRIRHRSHHFAIQSSHSVKRAGWQAKMASIEFWIPWRKCAQAPLTIFALPGGIWTPNAGNETWNARPKGKGKEKTEGKETGRAEKGREDLTKTEETSGFQVWFPATTPAIFFRFVSNSAKALFPTPFPLPFLSILHFNLHIARSVSSDISIWMGCVRITSWYPISMEAILAFLPALFIIWLDWVAKWSEW